MLLEEVYRIDKYLNQMPDKKAVQNHHKHHLGVKIKMSLKIDGHRLPL